MPISINIIFMHLLIAVSICTGLVIFIHTNTFDESFTVFSHSIQFKVFEWRRRCHKQSSNRCESRFPAIRVHYAIRARNSDRSSREVVQR